GAWNTGRYDLAALAGKEVLLTLSAQNDGEPGRLAMRVDDVSILACLPPEAFALQALPTFTPTPVPTAPAPLRLEPLEPSTPSTPLNTPLSTPLATPLSTAPESTILPQAAVVDSLEA